MPAEHEGLKFFLDENLPKSLWKTLRSAGYPADRAVDEGLRGKHDSAIFRQIRHRSVIITRDKDFLRVDLFPPPHSGILVVRMPSNTPVPDLVSTILEALGRLAEQELTNKLYVLEPGKIQRYY